MKYLPKKFLGHENVNCVVVWATKFFRKNMENPTAPPYKFNLCSVAIKYEVKKRRKNT